MARQGQGQVVRRDAATVITDAQQLDATLLDLDVDPPGASVQAVLQQLLGHRSRTLDHLAGGNLVGQPRTEQLDAPRLDHGWAARAVAGILRV